MPTPITVRDTDTNETWETTLEQYAADNRDDPPEVTIQDWFDFNEYRPILIRGFIIHEITKRRV